MWLRSYNIYINLLLIIQRKEDIMKLPNGYGSVSKVNRKNLRKKYIARITTDIEIDEQGKNISTKRQ